MKNFLVVILFLGVPCFPSVSQDYSQEIRGNWKCFKKELTNGYSDSLLYLHPEKYKECNSFLSIDSATFLMKHWTRIPYSYFIKGSFIWLKTPLSTERLEIKKLTGDTLIVEELKGNDIVSYKLSFTRTNEGEPVDAELDNIYTVVETYPEFPGGYSEFKKFIEQKLVYPSKAVAERVQGTVYLDIVISKTGRITAAKVISAPHMDMAIEAIKIVKAFPDWIPGKQTGKEVPVIRRIPIVFKFAK